MTNGLNPIIPVVHINERMIADALIEAGVVTGSGLFKRASLIGRPLYAFTYSRPNRPAFKSVTACMISSRVFITNGP